MIQVLGVGGDSRVLTLKVFLSQPQASWRRADDASAGTIDSCFFLVESGAFVLDELKMN